jgi:hypothetical protein
MPKCCAFLGVQASTLCDCTSKYTVDDLFYCGKHVTKAEKIKEEKDNVIVEELKKMVDVEKEVYEDDECAICHETFKYINTIVFLPCDHKFHVDCVAEWLKTGADSCPCCREKNTIGKTMPTFKDILKPWLIVGATFGFTGVDDVIRKWASESMEKYIKCQTTEEQIECEENIKDNMSSLNASIRATIGMPV